MALKLIHQLFLPDIKVDDFLPTSNCPGTDTSKITTFEPTRSHVSGTKE